MMKCTETPRGQESAPRLPKNPLFVHGRSGLHWNTPRRQGQEAKVSEAVRWLRVSHAGRFHWVHRRRGHEFPGRFKSALPLMVESRMR